MSSTLSDNMKIIVLIMFLCVTASVYAEPSAPSAKQIIDWAGFSKPVRLKAEKTKVVRGDLVKWGDPIWFYIYSAEETLSVYMIGLYKAGTLFGKNRIEIERRIEEQCDKFKELSEKSPMKDSLEMEKHIRIETRSDGRKVYFTIMSYGPYGVTYIGFTRLGGFDLLLLQMVSAEDDTPPEQKLKDPAEPKSKLPDIFKRLEEYIKKAKISR